LAGAFSYIKRKKRPALGGLRMGGRGQKGPVRELVEVILLAVVLAFVIRTFFFEVYRVEGASMESTLHTGDRVLVNKWLYLWRLPERGEVIVFQYPKDETRDFIKRVVAVSGDTVEIRQGKVYVNGELLPEAASALLDQETWAPQVVGPDTVWVLGDNRSNSDDSRYFGPVHRTQIHGEAFCRVWPLSTMAWIDRPALPSGGK
jgi:signal peptidase I